MLINFSGFTDLSPYPDGGAVIKDARNAGKTGNKSPGSPTQVSLPGTQVQPDAYRNSVVRGVQPIGPPVDVSGPGAVGRTDDAFILHLVEDSRRASVTEAQSPLEDGR